MKIAVFLLTALCCINPSFADKCRKYVTEDQHCLAISVWKEARGSSLASQKAVSEVILNRMSKTNKTCREVIREKGQFPWVKHMKHWNSTESQMNRLEVFQFLPQQLPSNYTYFNTIKHKFGRGAIQIGELYFQH